MSKNPSAGPGRSVKDLFVVVFMRSGRQTQDHVGYSVLAMSAVIGALDPSCPVAVVLRSPMEVGYAVTASGLLRKEVHV